jgi:MinD superfamily P-loop ATPase
VELLESITAWIKNRSATNIYWLSGAGGTGKTTVCRSVAKIASKFLAATFFLSDILDDGSNYSSSSIIPTLAYQIAATNARLHSEICDAISLDRDICSRSPEIQAVTVLLL